jgi:hypothetical protein
MNLPQNRLHRRYRFSGRLHLLTDLPGALHCAQERRHLQGRQHLVPVRLLLRTLSAPKLCALAPVRGEIMALWHVSPD